MNPEALDPHPALPPDSGSGSGPPVGLGFVREAWYVLAWDHEIGASGFFTRTVLGQALLAYRTADGEVVVLEDRCPHRQAPLSRGTREGDAIRCGYHGLKFDRSGHCVDLPGLEGPIPLRVCVRRYPVRVHRRWVMVWMGQAHTADPALLPDNLSCEHADWRYEPGYLHYETAWELIADNLLDFSHLSFVHAQTLGGSEQVARIRPHVETLPRGVRVSRRITSVPAPAYYRPLWDYTGLIDRWIDYDFLLPGILLMSSGACRAGADPMDDSAGIRFHSCQALTPETATCTHYFFQESHLAWQGNDQTTRGLFEGLLRAFSEDREMITAQARNLDPHRPMLALHMDSALMRFRARVQAAIQAEG